MTDLSPSFCVDIKQFNRITALRQLDNHVCCRLRTPPLLRYCLPCACWPRVRTVCPCDTSDMLPGISSHRTNAKQENLHGDTSTTGDETPSWDTPQTMPWLPAVVYESSRLLPPISQLANHRAARSIALDKEKIMHQGIYVRYDCCSNTREPGSWGADAEEFRPQRWGTTCEEDQRLYRLGRSRAKIISFRGGKRACLGEKYALTQIKMTPFPLITEFQGGYIQEGRKKCPPSAPILFLSILSDEGMLLGQHRCISKGSN